MVYRQEMQSQHAEATRGASTVWGTGDKKSCFWEVISSLCGVAPGRKETLELSPGKALAFQQRRGWKQKLESFKEGCCKLDLKIYLRILVESSGQRNWKEANAQ